MTYRVRISARARRDLEKLYRRIRAENSEQARIWFNGLEKAVRSLSPHPGHFPVIPENSQHRHLLYGEKRDVYRAIFWIDETSATVTIVNIRHGARGPFGGQPVSEH